MNMQTSSKVGVLIGIVSAVAFALPGSTFAKTIRVHPGQSIQAAVDAASPGDEIRVDPGVYQEQVVIEKNGLSLTGAGASETGSVLLAPAVRQETDCSEGTTFQDGICVLGNPTVEDVSVKGFLIRGYGDGGVTALFVSDLTVREVWSDANGFGFINVESSGLRIEKNIASRSNDLGIWVEDSPDANGYISKNEAYANRVGIIAIDSSHGKISDNYAHDNGLAIAIENDGAGASDWKVMNNRVIHNDGNYPEGYSFPGSPAATGSGISLQGASATVVKGNEVLNNQPAFPANSSGIDVHSTASHGGSDPINDVIQDNHVHGNLPYDLRWDGTGNPVFKHNDCDASNPPGLCQ